ncbi:DUF1553 domain-containing protein [Flammeovirga sp. EKP202]|uniref:DUF1553 domain-containing protein n=1 Tax=Flammeovirga sp. EKP202 TaxID=2770592 RepID=UPI001CB7EEEB|nr:DUF1553 domain-containing protein [Flammeovirga sp. EKP202]
MDLPQEVEIAYEELPAELDFNKDIKPILSDKCFACHGPDKGKIVAGLQLHSYATATQELTESKGKYAIVPGNPKSSEAVRRILTDDPDLIMPTPESHLSLTATEKATLIKWIEEGAEYKPHWSFVPMAKSEVEKAKDWGQNEIDDYVYKRLKQEKLKPSAEAEKSLLLRRVSLDLTGLPPTQQDLDAFLNDNDENAYEKQVDRLIASEAYGEKMATDWMDLARYADTHGYQVDRYRDMSPWRDWVIASFNNNMAYDSFLIYQLAGDLLPNPTRDQVLATGFNRLHPQNAEGGIVDEEFRVEYVADRTAVVGQGVMGLTFACARCHDHKYDPITQKNYYEIYSFFNNVNETGQISWDPNDIPVPTMTLPTEEQEEVIAYLEKICQQKDEKVKSAEQKAESTAEQWVNTSAYHTASLSARKHKVGDFSLNGNLKNGITGKKAKMIRKTSKNEVANYTEGKEGKGILLNGDTWIDMKPIGVFDRNDPFSISIWVNIPAGLKEGVIFHKNKAVMLHSVKGYTLYLKDNKLQTTLAHTYPENAILQETIEDFPRDKWVHVTLTYDGKSKAEGVTLYVDGTVAKMNTTKDNLTKSIIFNNYEDVIYATPIEPGLQVGARWRGFGLKDAKVDEVDVFNTCLTPLEVQHLFAPQHTKALLAKNVSSLSTDEKTLLKEHYKQRVSKEVQWAQNDYLKSKKELDYTYDTLKEVMVMKEMETPRQAYILERGVYSEHGEKVYPNTPNAILPFDKELPKNRLGLAQWIVDPRNPLPARVAVNRYWQNYFGTGIVETTGDFGNQGKLPTHPKLLDYLALEFIESGWDVKALQKKMVMSATYRQSSHCSPELREKDPYNTLLARGPQFRLSSEMMRDNALLASNLLKPKVGGKSVKPYQPEGLWKMNGGTYVQDHGDDLYRRSLYTFWKRTVPNPTQSTFDQPERSECAVKRQKTNTPLQALVLMNDPTYLEACRKLGEEITKSDFIDEGIQTVYYKLTGRAISNQELALLKEVQTKEIQRFETSPEKTKGWLSAGESEVDTRLNPSKVAANAIVASLILNSDATITRR